MTIPVEPGPWALADPDLEWATLSTEAKHERILCAAGSVFTQEGLDAPMPAIAAAAGAGIGSLYRQFPSKRDLVAALVTRRLEQTAEAADQAAATEGDHWEALVEMLWTLIERQSGDDFLGQALAQVDDHPDVVVARADATAAIERLLSAARSEGRLRTDASTLDIHLLFTATRAAKQVAPEAWRRTLALMIDGLAAGGMR